MSDANEAENLNLISSEANKREISTIGFPYVDMDEGISVARAILSKGGVPMDRDQLASAMGQVPGGAFNNKLSSARQFGFVSGAQGKWSLTDLGYEVLDPHREGDARAVAFLNVELYRKTYEEYKGKMLPPRPHGLENAFVSFGVSSKQKDKARQTFERSAKAAGFLTADGNRLVQPVIADRALAEAETFVPLSHILPEPGSGQSALAMSPSSARPVLSPFIEGLLGELPAPKSDWQVEDRAKWLQAAAQIFDLIYSGGKGRIEVKASSSS